MVVKFPTLSSLAAYMKLVQPKSYIINTIQLTVTTRLTAFELALAIEQYGGIEIQNQPAV